MGRPRARFAISPTTAFWALIMALCALSVYFAVKVEQRRGAWRQNHGEIDLKSGAAVQLLGVIDGDELSVRYGQNTFVVRLLGVRAFSPTLNEPGISHLGAQAAEALKMLVAGERLTLHFKKLARDKHKRVLAYLHVGGTSATASGTAAATGTGTGTSAGASASANSGDDVGLKLVKRGLVLVYRRYGFAREPRYLAAELSAKREKRGLWRSEKATVRATALEAAWLAQREEK